MDVYTSLRHLSGVEIPTFYTSSVQFRDGTYIRREVEYLVLWDKPGTRAAPGRFYSKIREELGSEVRFIQRSVYGVRTLKSAGRLAELARGYGLKVAIFRAVQITE